MALTKVTQSVLDYQPFSSGTVMLFQQTSAPTGWTKQTTHNDKALRVVSGSTSSGGSVGFTTAFASQSVSGTVGSTTLSTSQMPSHSHTHDGLFVSSYTIYDGDLDGSHVATGYDKTTISGVINAEGGGGSHNHSFSGTAINMAVQYVDVIFATKD